MSCILDTQRLDIGYQSHGVPENCVAKNMNLRLSSGHLVCLLGPNGAGKSTLIRTLGGLQKPLRGSVNLFSQCVASMDSRDRAKQLSVVLTSQIQIDYLSVRELIALGRYPYTNWLGNLSHLDWLVVDQTIGLLGLEKLQNRMLDDLSDGERQKALIGRALAQEPALVLLDEPTAFLDLPRKIELLSNLRRIAMQTDRSFLLSTHDLELALNHADVLWILDANGQFYAGIPEILALRGTISKIFDLNDIFFDVLTGSFKRNLANAIPIQLEFSKDDVAGVWTKRALERIGFLPVEDNTLLKLKLNRRSNNWLWMLKEGSKNSTFDNLENLLDQLKTHCR